MPRIRSLAAALVLGASLLVTGCADLPTAPEPVADPAADPSYGLLGSDGLLSGLTGRGGGGGGEVSVLERRVPLERDEVVTRTIGRRGGVIRLPEAGLTVVFPWGALRSDTEITVTAPAGDLVGYHFAPHGIQFRRSVTIMQDLDLRRVLSLDRLSAHYFDGELQPKVTSLERLTLWLLRTLGIFKIDHFSGYVIATT
jgi:hypothetical protein